jgi:amino acid permease
MTYHHELDEEQRQFEIAYFFIFFSCLSFFKTSKKKIEILLPKKNMELYFLLFICTAACLILLAIAWMIWAIRKKAWNLCPPDKKKIENDKDKKKEEDHEPKDKEKEKEKHSEEGNHNIDDHLTNMFHDQFDTSYFDRDNNIMKESDHDIYDDNTARSF